MTLNEASPERQRWIDGAEHFRQWCGSLTPAEQDALRTLHPEVNLGPLALLFLGEKPALCDDQIASHLGGALQRAGFVVRDDVVYDPQHVARLQSDLKLAPYLGDAQQLDLILSPWEKGQDHHIAFGLLMGFPLSSAMVYAPGWDKDRHLDDSIDDVFFLLRDDPTAEAEYNSLCYAMQPDSFDMNIITKIVRKYGWQVGLTPRQEDAVLDYIAEGHRRPWHSVHGMAWVDREPNPDSDALVARLLEAYKYTHMQQLIEEAQRPKHASVPPMLSRFRSLLGRLLKR